MKGGVPVSWAGSLFQDREFRRGVIRLLRMIRGEFTFRPRRPIQDPAEAAARWGAALKETKAKDFPERS
jgi:hypothetical protein